MNYALFGEKVIQWIAESCLALGLEYFNTEYDRKIHICPYLFAVIMSRVLLQMLRKSVETRDCLSAVEPRTVRAAMKRVVEDIAAMDVVIGQLYEEGVRTERTSDSTRRSYTYAIGRQGAAAGPVRSTWSITPR